MSRASIERLDEDRIRKVAADNPDLLHNRLAQRFGISVQRLRRILGAKGGELFDARDMAHYTPRPGLGFAGRFQRECRARRIDEIRKKLREEENKKRGDWDPDFKPMRRPNGRGGPHDGR